MSSYGKISYPLDVSLMLLCFDGLAKYVELLTYCSEFRSGDLRRSIQALNILISAFLRKHCTVISRAVIHVEVLSPYVTPLKSLGEEIEPWYNTEDTNV
ncbi:hypothetical protein TNIN_180931 [Trichonephila inaurata madagascariensis]|uniref:Uncharacterized protein n=1 Tax=Trichonephila inaurata madagascariensis TaxID=2747483 RepID=A0A8X6I6U9_9ARAC|nr:hypothetical protein TNIN_180931 [Trichonephila inaurata madagascariensis]